VARQKMAEKNRIVEGLSRPQRESVQRELLWKKTARRGPSSISFASEEEGEGAGPDDPIRSGSLDLDDHREEREGEAASVRNFSWKTTNKKKEGGHSRLKRKRSRSEGSNSPEEKSEVYGEGRGKARSDSLAHESGCLEKGKKGGDFLHFFEGKGTVLFESREAKKNVLAPTRKKNPSTSYSGGDGKEEGRPSHAGAERKSGQGVGRDQGIRSGKRKNPRLTITRRDRRRERKKNNVISVKAFILRIEKGGKGRERLR